ncbi:hypothetical protein Pmar_PMAR027403 [Perkinsus marinus ATCC 50983]|uniref:Uncharacterized protein n=1 Tax=Perkinsus marinus (strain ATCC 50983 / TXsc) TaxID=423536 RepID=C5KSH1_PERM5|nr:hypothetical protein Pmar_PMAR027403 [Perkinsus marinus ATCC 50983]EER12585.1 hypothetical protein Pmar_PMAR027403 [Perkinsus marinus ATCC 50983]|eukprot:XP_002780790.1 hypothetical protein Pmar_PMAR027403 [Perkinsus marinus ATCC 50983]
MLSRDGVGLSRMEVHLLQRFVGLTDSGGEAYDEVAIPVRAIDGRKKGAISGELAEFGPSLIVIYDLPTERRVLADIQTLVDEYRDRGENGNQAVYTG